MSILSRIRHAVNGTTEWSDEFKQATRENKAEAKRLGVDPEDLPIYPWERTVEQARVAASQPMWEIPSQADREAGA